MYKTINLSNQVEISSKTKCVKNTLSDSPTKKNMAATSFVITATPHIERIKMKTVLAFGWESGVTRLPNQFISSCSAHELAVLALILSLNQFANSDVCISTPEFFAERLTLPKWVINKSLKSLLKNKIIKGSFVTGFSVQESFI